jgi:hypothetical protein
MGCSRKDPYSPHGGNFCRLEGEKKLFLIIVNVLGYPKGVEGLTSYFLHEGGMDVFWNDPIIKLCKFGKIYLHIILKVLPSEIIKIYIAVSL